MPRRRPQPNPEEGGSPTPRRADGRLLAAEASAETDAETRCRTSRAVASGAMKIRTATRADAEAIAAIYNHEATRERTTFDLRPRSVVEQQEWLAERSGAHSVIVAVLNGEVVGFASLSPYRPRPAYNTSVESSVFVRRDSQRRGIGRALLEHLVALAAEGGFHSMIARIAGRNEASVALHARCGFELVGVEREIGRKFGRWLDCTVMQRLLG